MYQIVYLSSATELFSADDVSELLQAARATNDREKLTGLLIYHGGCFVQVLEGEEPIVKNRFDVIGKDTRHNNCITLFSGAVPQRSFPDWQMGYSRPQDVSTNEAEIVTHLVTLRDNLDDIVGANTRLSRIVRRFLGSFRELSEA